ncbi:MAG: hypothetical protein AAB339_03905 [Elusimicrobiota bacterium]
MKYLQSGGFQHQPLMRLTLAFSLLLLLGLWLTNWAMFLSRMSLTPSSVAAYYLGSEEEFRNPKTAAALLETTHMHLPIMAVVLLLLTHLLIFAPYSDKAKVFFVSASFLSALSNEGSGWLVRFVHPGFAWLKLLSFLCLQAMLAFLLFALGVFLRSGHSGAPHHPAHSKR